ncbi:hypothetical protein BDW62DRAFT_125300 [Aspergillus aurantiobrunneus]
MSYPHLPLLQGQSVTFSQALADRRNMVHQLELPPQESAFHQRLLDSTQIIQRLVNLHLRVKNSHVAGPAEWQYGAYNVSIPVYLDPESQRYVLFRIPLPYTLGEWAKPGCTGEKLRCEVATYIWIRQHCPTIPIPHLYGFALKDDSGLFVEPAVVSCYARYGWRARRKFLRLRGAPEKIPFVKVKARNELEKDYMIVRPVTHGRKLSETLEKLLTAPVYKQIFLRHLAEIMLALSTTSFPQIGSLTFGNKRVVELTNRPLTPSLVSWDDAAIATIPRHQTFQDVETYIVSLLDSYDEHLRHQPNAIRDEADGRAQMAALVLMRALLHQFVSKQYHKGPFTLALTELSPDNIIVDDEGRIVSLIDLDWACSLPVEMLKPPYWLPGVQPHGYPELIDDFLEIFKGLEDHRLPDRKHSHAGIMRACLARGSHWYFRALCSGKGMADIVTHRIERKYLVDNDNHDLVAGIFSEYWCPDSAAFITERRHATGQYNTKLEEIFSSSIKTASQTTAEITDPGEGSSSGSSDAHPHGSTSEAVGTT